MDALAYAASLSKTDCEKNSFIYLNPPPLCSFALAMNAVPVDFCEKVCQFSLDDIRLVGGPWDSAHQRFGQKETYTLRLHRGRSASEWGYSIGRLSFEEFRQKDRRFVRISAVEICPFDMRGRYVNFDELINRELPYLIAQMPTNLTLWAHDDLPCSQRDEAIRIVETIESYRTFNDIELHNWGGKSEPFALRSLASNAVKSIGLRGTWPSTWTTHFQRFIAQASGKLVLLTAVPWDLEMFTAAFNKWSSGEVEEIRCYGLLAFDELEFSKIRPDLQLETSDYVWKDDSGREVCCTPCESENYESAFNFENQFSA